MGKVTKEMIDEGCALVEQIAKLTKRLDEIKGAIKECAVSSDKREFAGIVHQAKVADRTSWTIGFQGFASYMKKQKGKGWEAIAADFVTVKTGEVKKYLGEDALATLGNKTVDKAVIVKFV